MTEGLPDLNTDLKVLAWTLMCSRRKVIPENFSGVASTAGILFSRAGIRDASILFGRGRVKTTNPQPNPRILECM